MFWTLAVGVSRKIKLHQGRATRRAKDNREQRAPFTGVAGHVAGRNDGPTQKRDHRQAEHKLPDRQTLVPEDMRAGEHARIVGQMRMPVAGGLTRIEKMTMLAIMPTRYSASSP